MTTASDGGPTRPAARLTVATELSALSASTRYRALQYVPRLQRRFDVTVSLPDDELRRLPGRAGQARYFAGHFVHYAQRRGALSHLLPGQDTILIQRGLYRIGPGQIMRPVERFDGRVVVDLDDAVFEISPDLARKGAAARWLYGPQQALRALRRADAIVVSTAVLADALPPGVASPTILPTVPDPSVYTVRGVIERQPVRIGWVGTIGGLTHLDPLAHVFARLRDEGVAALEVVSSQAWPGPAAFYPWRLQDEVSVFGRFDVGIMPLSDTPYTRAKAGFKLLQYMCAGIPVVASPVGVNRELIERSNAGLIAKDPADWERALRKLSVDSALRAELGASGRRFIERYADLDAHAGTLAALLSVNRALMPVVARGE
jgi:glycosyltransferase involved in cell wall biosynthesis